MRNHVFAAGVVVVSVVGFAAAAQADTANNYNLFVLGDMKAMNSATQGRVAVAGDASLTNYSVGQKTEGKTAGLVVGGNLTTQSGSTDGAVVTGGKASLTWYRSGEVTSGSGELPVDFKSEGGRLTELSKTLSGEDATGKASSTYGGWRWSTTLVGREEGLNVFNLDGDTVSRSNVFNIDIAKGSTVLINVSGEKASMWGAGFNISGGDASSILWNFYQATSLSFYDIGVQGSVLAPNATYDPDGWGRVDGQMIVRNFIGDNSGSTTLNNVAFKGGLLAPLEKLKELEPVKNADNIVSAVPEPATWTLLIGGFALMGMAVRARRPDCNKLSRGATL